MTDPSPHSAHVPGDGPEEDMRTRILAGALHILAHEGQQALTVRRVATTAGCSTIGVYTYFGGKDGLMDALWVDGFTSLERELLAYSGGRTGLDALRATATAYRTWALENPAHYQVMLAQPQGYELSAAAGEVGLRAFLILRGAVESAQQLGQLATDDLDALTLSCWGLVHGLIALQLGDPKPRDLRGVRSLDDRAFDIAIDTFVAGLRQSVTGGSAGSNS